MDYDYVGDIPPSLNGCEANHASFRFRVMAFPRTDGSPLQVAPTLARSPDLVDLAGATFVVNGRPFNGTGVGYNPLATVGQPRLNAVQIHRHYSTTRPLSIYPEIALTPNSTYFFPRLRRFL